MFFPFLLPDDLIRSGLDDTILRREAARGELIRVRRGVYLRQTDWAPLSELERHRARILATALVVTSRVVFSHESAAALWGMPVLDSWPTEVHVIDPARKTGQRTPTLVRHPGPSVSSVVVDGVDCTSAARTAVDLACLRGFAQGLLACDFGLAHNLFRRDDLLVEVRSRPTAQRRRQATAAVRHADAASGSPGESVSRASMIEMGVPRPELQKKFAWPGGQTYYADFWWPDSGVVGEFDGEVKYLDPRLREGQTIERVILRERERHAAILARPEVRNLVRWNYATARSPTRLAAVLGDAGVEGVRS